MVFKPVGYHHAVLQFVLLPPLLNFPQCFKVISHYLSSSLLYSSMITECIGIVHTHLPVAMIIPSALELLNVYCLNEGTKWLWVET